MAGDQFEVEGGGDQFVIVGLGIEGTAQPIAGGATGTKADHAEADEATENLSAGE